MPVAIKTNIGGGSVTLDAGTGSSDTTLTLPNTSGTILQSGTTVTVAQGGTGLTTPGANGNILTSDGTVWTSAAPSGGGLPTPSAVGQIPFSTNGSTYAATQKITQGTAVASTSGTSIDFTSIPSWVKRVTVMLSGVSTNGSSSLLIQSGSGSIQTSGYLEYGGLVSSGGNALTTSSTAGFQLYLQSGDAAATNRYGHILLTSMGSNLWVMSAVIGIGTTVGAGLYGGNVTLGGALDRVRITTVNGTDTFDAGSINILYE